jgi:acyl-CoA dehydrogenase
VILPYFLHYADEEQRNRWFPGLAAGTVLTAVAMTEPGTGSDLAGMRTTATRDGDSYVVNGAKTFITGGIQADLVIVVARTSTDPENRRKGLTLLVVEDGMPGFTRGRELDKMGCKVQDTAELSFADVRVPVANRLGEEGEAFGYLGHNLPQERLTVAVGSVSQARSAVMAPIDYVKDRKAFGTPRSRTPSSSSPRARRRSRRLRRCWIARSKTTWTASSPAPTPHGSSCSAPRCRPGSWTAACSCSAATAT